MSTQDHAKVLAFYQALRIEADKEAQDERAREHGAWLVSQREPLETVTARIRAMVEHYLAS
jgi:hypothetical protein